VTTADVYKFYSAGPPYILHAHDVGPFAHEWARLVPPTYNQYPMLYAEMFAYSMAAAQLALPHVLLPHLMTGCMVGWPRSDPEPLARSFEAYGAAAAAQQQQQQGHHGTYPGGGAATCFLPSLAVPPFLHYCQHYKNQFGEPFTKRGVPHNTLECSSPRLSAGGPRESMKHAASSDTGKDNDLQWQTLACCASQRAIDHARDQRCIMSATEEQRST